MPAATARRAVRRARPRRRVRLDNDARRAQLLALARKAFADNSYDDCSIDDLAHEAKISKGLLYHYFPTKRDLYVAALREIADELVARVIAISVDLPPAERVRGGLDAYLGYLEHHARAFVALMRGGIGSDPEVAAIVEGVRKRLSDLLLEGSPFAKLLGDSPRFTVAARGWIGFVEQVSIDWCADPRMSRGELIELLSQILFAIISTVAPQILRGA